MVKFSVKGNFYGSQSKGPLARPAAEAAGRRRARGALERREIIIRTAGASSATEWLKRSWDSAQEQGLDQLSAEEIDNEIAAVRKARRERTHPER